MPPRLTARYSPPRGSVCRLGGAGQSAWPGSLRLPAAASRPPPRCTGPSASAGRCPRPGTAPAPAEEEGVRLGGWATGLGAQRRHAARPGSALTSLLMAMLHMHSVAASRISSCSSNMYPSIMGTAFSFRIFCLRRGVCQHSLPRAERLQARQGQDRPPSLPPAWSSSTLAPPPLPQPLADASQVG